jgi:hypothetical protein
MKTVSEIRIRLAALAKTAWEYLGVAGSTGTWGYRTPSAQEIQENTRRWRELLQPASSDHRVCPAGRCDVMPFVPCCA